MTDQTAKDAAKQYKPTVLLPKTDFDMRANLAAKEPARQSKWDADNLYANIREDRKAATAWVLHDGPPYANGDAHTGTGMNKILKDMVVKFRTMQGFNVPYVPGWDCHGLPIEHNVLKELGGRKPEDMTNVQLREKCLEYANSFVAKQRDQFKTTGTLGRWEDPYLTTSPRYESNVLRVFRDLFERGFITRAKRPVHWSWAAQSALAEAELEYEDREDLSVFVLMKSNAPVAGVDDVHFLIWTTTPWTLPANRAIAVAKDAEYSVVEFDWQGAKARMVVAEDLRENVAAKSGLENVNVLATARGSDLIGATYTQPLWGLECPVVAADYVTLEDGTGLVHTAPGHGKEDFETGKTHGIPAVCPVSPTGQYYTGDRLREELQLADDYTSDWFDFIDGQHIMKANDKIAEKLGEQGLLLHSERFNHSYPHCWRTHKPVIFRVTEQWFVNVDHVDPDTTLNPDQKPLRERILNEIKNVDWFPAWGEKRITSMVENRPDWCISRQRFWGIPIPAFLDPETGKVCMTTETVNHVIDLVEQHGSNVWYDDENWPVDKLLPHDVRPDEFKGRPLNRMEDIFDVWFESGASHRAVMLADDELKEHFPAALYLEGDDQHRGWFQVSLILSVATQGKSPFKQCLTSAFVVDEKGEKASKSKGNIWPIDKGCRDLGADLIRLYFASVNTSEPIPVTYDLIKGAGDSYRKLRNTFRTLVGNLADFDPTANAVGYDDLRPVDQWALSRVANLITEVTSDWERYEFHHATRKIVHFCIVDLSSQYIDACKDALYCEASDSAVRRGIQTVYHVLASTLNRLLAPVLVHTAAEMWEHLPAASDSVHLADWPTVEGFVQRDEALETRFALFFKLKAESDRVLDRMRKDKQLGKGYDAEVTFQVADDLKASIENDSATDLAGLLNVSKLNVVTDDVADAETGVEFPEAKIKVTKLDTEACVRCYRRTGDVGTIKDHPYLCGRCHDVVQSL